MACLPSEVVNRDPFAREQGALAEHTSAACRVDAIALLPNLGNARRRLCIADLARVGRVVALALLQSQRPPPPAAVALVSANRRRRSVAAGT